MKLTISKDLKEILPSFLVSAYTFDLLEKMIKNIYQTRLAKVYLKLLKNIKKTIL